MFKKAKALKESLEHIERLQKQDAKKTEFFLAASHQLKAPVNIIQWCLQSVVEKPKGLDPHTKDMLAKAMVQANAASHLVTDMLHIFRLVNRQNKGQATVTAVDINRLLQEILTQYQLAAHRQGVHVIAEDLPVLPTVYGDEPYLKQALINLLDNAIKYSSRGGKVEVSGKKTRDGFVEISFRDHGIGIADLDQLKLFTEFFRSDEAQKHAHEGTGLGLVLVKHVVEECGGEIQVRSALHRGSTFTVRLPAGR